MRILAHIHTLNDVDIVDATIESVQRQTHPVDEILLVDNGSTDGTLERPILSQVTVIRHAENGGTSGAVYTGLKYGLDHDYDWVWVFDADSLPEPDALGKLLELYATWPKERQDETAFLACLHANLQDGIPRHAGLFTARGIDQAKPARELRYYPCHYTIWSGSLYRMAAVRKIGLPNPDYMLDWGEGEYGYRIMRAGYQGYTDQESLLHHNIRGRLSFEPIKVNLGLTYITLLEFKPIRIYYQSRNMVYFLLYEAARWQVGLLARTVLNVVTQTLGFMLRPRNHGQHILACVLGLWHGVTGKIEARY